MRATSALFLLSSTPSTPSYRRVIINAHALVPPLYAYAGVQRSIVAVEPFAISFGGCLYTGARVHIAGIHTVIREIYSPDPAKF